MSALQELVRALKEQINEKRQLMEVLKDNNMQMEQLQVKAEQEQQRKKQIQKLKEYSKFLEALLRVKENREEPWKRDITNTHTATNWMLDLEMKFQLPKAWHSNKCFYDVTNY